MSGDVQLQGDWGAEGECGQGGVLRAVLMGRGWRSRGADPNLEGLPVDGTRSVFFIFPLGHPHLLKGVQRRQDGAAAGEERGEGQSQQTKTSTIFTRV